jgi:transcription elongation factor GreA
MAEDKLPMTVKGKIMLETELKRLLHEERPAVIKAIEEARAHGDISENAEFDAAKERQALCEGRIAEIQGKIASAEVIDPKNIKSDKIVFGAIVVIADTESSEVSKYQIVGTDEADVKQGKISVMSPLARALIGRVPGDVVLVKGAKAEKEYEISSFSFE